MLSKKKDLGQGKLMEPWTEPSRMPGRSNFFIYFTTTPFRCPPLLLLQIFCNKTAIKTLEVVPWKEKTYILLVTAIKIIMPLIDIPIFFAETHSCSPLVLDWTEISTSGPHELRDSPLGPMNRGTHPQPAKTTAIPGWAAEHWWTTEVCPAPGGLSWTY